MYLRPGMLIRSFTHEHKSGSKNSNGRIVTSYEPTGKIIRAVLAQASPTEIAKYDQMQHPITHTVVQQGGPQAAAGDRLVHASRVFYIQGVDNIAELGHYTLYQAQERVDTNE